MNKTKIHRGIIIYNEEKEKAVAFYNNVKKFLIQKNIEIIEKDMLDKATFAVVIGGDGTLLRASKILIRNKKLDIFAVNAGSLGFLTEIKSEEFESTFDDYLCGKTKKETRYFLEAELVRKNLNNTEKVDILNEIVVSKQMASSKILNISMKTEETDICDYKVDGIIVATPTGSTAYSLSAGGPIVMPQIKAITVTPLAPHNLATRPIIISGEEKLILNLKQGQEGSIIVDGEKWIGIKNEDILKIHYSGKKIDLILPMGRNYYGILRAKLKWGDNLC